MDQRRRLATIETTLIDDRRPAAALPDTLLRFQLANHVGSSTVELDGAGAIVSYEEYYPYGGTAHQAVRPGVEVPRKRYRYAGAERDPETGLYYQGARYYAPWLGAWTSCDPAGIKDSPNLYRFVLGNPVRLVDPTGHGGVETDEVRPALLQLLADKKLNYATEVTFDLLDNKGNYLMEGRFDVVFRDPRTGNLVIPETKGMDLDALTTNQKVYVKLMESGEGAQIKIRSWRGGKINVAYGSTHKITQDHFVRVGRSNLKDFADALEQITTGGRVKFSWADATGVRYFRDADEYGKFLKMKGLRWRVPGARVLKGIAIAGSIAGTAAEAAEPLAAAQQIDDLSASLGNAVGKSFREMIIMENTHLKLVQSVEGGWFLFDPLKGDLWMIDTDLQAMNDWNRPVYIGRLWKPTSALKAGHLEGSDIWTSTLYPPSGEEPLRVMVWKDEDQQFYLGRWEEQGVFDYAAESVRTTWVEMEHAVGW
jgi:RHS repeat-associated protein